MTMAAVAPKKDRTPNGLKQIGWMAHTTVAGDQFHDDYSHAHHGWGSSCRDGECQPVFMFKRKVRF